MHVSVLQEENDTACYSLYRVDVLFQVAFLRKTRLVATLWLLAIEEPWNRGQ